MSTTGPFHGTYHRSAEREGTPMGQHEMSPKSAALAVHALAAHEQREVLRTLTPTQRQHITPLLEQLRSLGVPAATNLRIERRPAQRAERSAEQRCAALSVEDVTRITAQQSPATVAALLRAGSWPWKDAFLQALSETRRGDVLACMKLLPQHGTAVRSALLGVLLPAVQQHTTGPSTLRSFLARLRLWTR